MTENSIENLLRQFQDVARNPYEPARKWKQENPWGKVVGYLPMYFPEEMIHATGNLPVGIWGSDEPISLADSRIQTFYCGPARSIVEKGMKGQLAFLDGIVAQDTCLAIRQLSDLMPRCVSRDTWFYGLYIPMLVNSKHARKFARESMLNFKFAFEAFAGDEIELSKLRQSMKLYDKQRTLMRDLYTLRREKPNIIRAREFYAVVMSSMVMPKEEHIAWLENLLKGLASRRPVTDGQTRLVLAGSLCEPVRDSLLDTIEDSGAVIVDDDLDVGFRRFETEVSMDGDPLEALVDAHLTGLPPCPTKMNSEKDWGKNLAQKVKQSRAQGIINIVIRECEPHYFSAPKVRETLQKAKIPEMTWEEEPSAEMIGQLRTRIQAFLEMIQG